MPADKLWWLSFAGDGGNLGVAVVAARNFGSAIAEAYRLGINPGGEVMGFECPPDCDEAKVLGVGRLISPEEMARAGYAAIRETEEEKK
jgi:hypothetical protein